jgi:hypothetical protein
MGRSRGNGDDLPQDFPDKILNRAVETYEGIMTHSIVCPFYGKSDDYCDIGCGYISPYDVNVIIRYCSRCYKECLKYQELAERFPAEAPGMVKC